MPCDVLPGDFSANDLSFLYSLNLSGLETLTRGPSDPGEITPVEVLLAVDTNRDGVPQAAEVKGLDLACDLAGVSADTKRELHDMLKADQPRALVLPPPQPVDHNWLDPSEFVINKARFPTDRFILRRGETLVVLLEDEANNSFILAVPPVGSPDEAQYAVSKYGTRPQLPSNSLTPSQKRRVVQVLQRLLHEKREQPRNSTGKFVMTEELWNLGQLLQRLNASAYEPKPATQRGVPHWVDDKRKAIS